VIPENVTETARHWTWQSYLAQVIANCRNVCGWNKNILAIITFKQLKLWQTEVPNRYIDYWSISSLIQSCFHNVLEVSDIQASLFFFQTEHMYTPTHFNTKNNFPTLVTEIWQLCSLFNIVYFSSQIYIGNSYNKTNEMHEFLKSIFGMKLYMFWTGFLYIIRSLVLYDIYLLLCIQY